MKYLTKSPKDTEKLAGFLLEKFTKLGLEKSLVIALEGELGAGKTTFVKGVAKALKIKTNIKSPTFNLMKTYEIRGKSHKTLYHFDCYRLKDHRDLEVMGIKEILNNPDNIILIEWSDRVKKILPKKYIKVHIDHISSNERSITIK